MVANLAQTKQEIKADISIRVMQVSDIKSVMAIEVKAYPQPWTVGIFRDCLRVGYRAWVMLQQTEIIGYGIVLQAHDEAHILNICITPNQQGKGLGRYLLRHLVEESKQGKTDMILLEVRRSNPNAHALYASEGFHELGVRKNYYPTKNGREDAIILAKYLSR